MLRFLVLVGFDVQVSVQQQAAVLGEVIAIGEIQVDYAFLRWKTHRNSGRSWEIGDENLASKYPIRIANRRQTYSDFLYND